MVYDFLEKSLRGEDYVENGVPMSAIGLDALQPMADLRGVAAAGGRFNEYVSKSYPGLGDVMGWAVNNITLVGGLDSIL